MGPERGKRDLVWVAAAAAAALIAPALLRGRGLFPGALSDQLLYFWPWRLFLRRELLAGHFPLWNPLLAAGVPFLACVQAAPLFPTELFLAWLPPVPWSLLSAFLKLFVAGLFASLQARRLGASRAGANLSGVSFALCGFMVAWLGYPQSNAACLLPMLFWSLGGAFDAPRPRAWVWVALAVGGILLGGHPPTALHVLTAGGAYALFLGRRAPRRLAWAALAVLAGACLAAPALFPYIKYVCLSSTAASSAAYEVGRMSPHSAQSRLIRLA